MGRHRDSISWPQAFMLAELVAWFYDIMGRDPDDAEYDALIAVCRKVAVNHPVEIHQINLRDQSHSVH